MDGVNEQGCRDMQTGHRPYLDSTEARRPGAIGRPRRYRRWRRDRAPSPEPLRPTPTEGVSRCTICGHHRVYGHGKPPQRRPEHSAASKDNGILSRLNLRSRPGSTRTKAFHTTFIPYVALSRLPSLLHKSMHDVMWGPPRPRPVAVHKARRANDAGEH